MLVRVPRARVLEECPQLHLVARQVGIAAGWGCVGVGGSQHPPPWPWPYQEEKHWRVLITHCSCTRDPPQKCTPALQGQGVSSWRGCRPCSSASGAPAHRLRMLTVQGELPGWPPTMRPFHCSLSSRRPHCSNVTTSAGRGDISQGHATGTHPTAPTRHPWAPTCVLQDRGHCTAGCGEKAEGGIGVGPSHPAGTKTTQGVAGVPPGSTGCWLVLTAGLDGTVVEGGARVHGVAPGAMAVVIGVAAVVLLQVCLRVGDGRDPAGKKSPSPSPSSSLSPFPHAAQHAPSHTHWGTWGAWAAHGWQVMPWRVLLMRPW